MRRQQNCHSGDARPAMSPWPPSFALLTLRLGPSLRNPASLGHPSQGRPFTARTTDLHRGACIATLITRLPLLGFWGASWSRTVIIPPCRSHGLCIPGWAWDLSVSGPSTHQSTSVPVSCPHDSSALSQTGFPEDTT